MRRAPDSRYQAPRTPRRHTTPLPDSHRFGAAWFTDPSKLFPLVHRHLNPGGIFVFSQPPAIPGAYGPQGMYKGGFAGKATFAYRYSYRPAVWERLLTRAGFSTAEVRVLDAPEPGHIGTLIVRATA